MVDFRFRCPNMGPALPDFQLMATVGPQTESVESRLGNRYWLAATFHAALFREPIALHCGTKQKAPGLCRGPLLKQQGSAYRLTWTVAPPLGPLFGPLPGMSPAETSLTQSEPSPL